jgi:type IV pilus assembly protein PilE
MSLLELMIVVVIIGVLAAIVYPAYQDYVREARRADGHAALTRLAAQQERFFADRNTYTTTLTAAATGLGYPNPAMSSDGYYSLAAAACGGGAIGTCYLLTATPQGVQAGDAADCTTITLDSTGAQGSTGALPAVDCWNK